MQRDRYPANWKAIALRVKEASSWTCQNCGKECRRPGESLFEFCDRILGGNFRDNCEIWSEVADHPQRWTLTVAHLDQDPGNNDPSNLRALCAPCHLKHDRPFRSFNSRTKLERNGQLTIEMLATPEPAGQGKDPTRIQLPIRSTEGHSGCSI